MSKRERKPKGGSVEPSIRIDATSSDDTNAGDAGNSDSEDGGIASITIDPASVGRTDDAGSGDSEPRRGRGRPRGSGTAQKAKALPLNVSGVEKLLIGIHGGIAMLSGRMEWSLDTTEKAFDGKTESEFLSQSMMDVAKHYGAGVLDQKTVDWLNLIQCLAIVYGGRLVAIRMSRKPKPEAPKVFTPQPPQGQTHRTPAPVNNFSSDAGAVDIAGLGRVVLPDDNPLSPNFKPRMN